jgi:tubulin---tyrosine ligase
LIEPPHNLHLKMNTKTMFAFVQSGYPWLDEHIKSFVKKYSHNVILIEDLGHFPDDESTLLQFCDYQHYNFVIPLRNAKMSLINMYPNVDALTRKNYLSKVIEYWTAKREESILKSHVPTTVRLELDYAEYVEDALAEADLELYHSLEANEEKEPSAREWWILKPALADGGYGIQIFSTITELSGYLESTESLDGENTYTKDDRIPSSQLREFVAQKYLSSVPLLDKRKFHIRAYVLAIGRLQVFVYREMLVLVAQEAYRPPWDGGSLKSSLTNTSLQGENIRDSIRNFWSTPDILPGDWKEDAFQQICLISAEVFQAASHTMAERFVVLPNCFELFALDFLIDVKGSVWLLEVNTGPAFYQEGEAGALAVRLFESVICVTVKQLAQTQSAEKSPAEELMIEVLSEDLGKCNIREI